MSGTIATGTRERLLSAARQLIEEGGYGGASVLAIADRAGVAAGTLYRHFASKEELFVEVFRSVCEREERAMRAAADRLPETATAQERLETVLATFARRALRNPRLAWALIAEPVDPRVDAERIAYRAHYAEAHRGRPRRGDRRGRAPRAERGPHGRGTGGRVRGGAGRPPVAPVRRRPRRRRDRGGAEDVRGAGGGSGMIEGEPVEVTRDGPVTTVLLSRPERRNAVDGPTAAALSEAFRALDADRDAAVAVLAGEGGAFCAGADLKAVGTRAGNRVAAAGDGPMGPTRMRLSKPVIAAIAGHAVAGGLELALWCDLRVAEEDAVLGVFCRRWGVPLIDGGTVRLPRLIGAGRALDMILTGRPVGADGGRAHGPGQPGRADGHEPRRRAGAGRGAGARSPRRACARTGSPSLSRTGAARPRRSSTSWSTAGARCGRSRRGWSGSAQARAVTAPSTDPR